MKREFRNALLAQVTEKFPTLPNADIDIGKVVDFIGDSVCAEIQRRLDAIEAKYIRV